MGSSKEYREANKDKIKAYGVAYRKASKDKKKAWAAANRDKTRAHRRAFYARNKAKVKEWQAAYWERATENLHDQYIRRCLNVPKRLAPLELIEAKRLQLKIYRMTKEMA